MPISDDLALAKLLGALYTEVFAKKPSNPNKPLNQSAHLLQDQPIKDDTKSVLIPNTVTYVWGTAGTSGEAPVASTDIATRWSEIGTWA